MLSCKDISHLTSELLDNKLSFSMRVKVKLHLLMCHSCRRFVKQMRTTVDTIKQLKPTKPKEEEVNQQVEKIMTAIKDVDSETHK